MTIINLIKMRNKIILASIIGIGIFFRLLRIPELTGESSLLFIDPDSYYHLRRIVYETLKYPSILHFDWYSGFPKEIFYNTPPLFDLIVSTFSYVIGLGKPSVYLIERVSALSPMIFGVFTLPVVYSFSKKVLNIKVGLLSALFLSIVPAHVYYSSFGYVDHHSAEVFFSTLLFLLVLISINTQKTPVNIFTGGILAICFLTWQGSLIYLLIMDMFFISVLIIGWYKNMRIGPLVRTSLIIHIVSLLILLPACIFYSREEAFSTISLSWFHVLYLLWFSFLSFLFVTKSKPGKLIALSSLAFLSIIILIFGINKVLIGIHFLTKGSPLYRLMTETTSILSPEGRWSTYFVSTYLSYFFFIVPFILFFYWKKILNEIKNKKININFYLLTIWSTIAFFLPILQGRFCNSFSIPESILFGHFCISSFDFWNRSKIKSRYPLWVFIILMTGASIGIFHKWISDYIVYFREMKELLNGEKITINDEKMFQHEIYKGLIWLKDNSPETRGYLDPSLKPEYGVMANWQFGHIIPYVARRPNIANNSVKLEGIEAHCRFFLATDEKTAIQILKDYSAKYVISTHPFYDIFECIDLLGIPKSEFFYDNEIPTNEFYNTIIMRLYYGKGKQKKVMTLDGRKITLQPVSHLRLIYESQNPKNVFYQVKIFQVE